MTVLDRAVAADMPAEARILIIDIERRPMLSYHWSPKVDYIPPSMNVERGSIISFAAKWYGDRRTIFRSVHHDDRDEMLAEAWRLLDEAHIVVGYNSQGFDVKHLAEEFARDGMGPPSPWFDVDLLRAVRSRFRFAYNKLDEVCRELGLELKLANDGWDLWLACMDGDDKAWRTMKRYNVRDVEVTEALYDRLRPWIKGHPNVNLFREERLSGCGHCGSADVEASGFHYTPTRAYRRFVCNSCGAWSRATHSESTMTQHRRAV